MHEFSENVSPSRLAEDDEVGSAHAHFVEVGALDRQNLNLREVGGMG